MAAQDSVRTTGFPCKQCGTICPNMPSLLEHMDAHFEQEEERKFKCDICGRGYRHAGSLANHKKTHEVGCFQCNVCGKEHSNALALKSHLRIHTSQKKHSCGECGKGFRLATQLATHAKVHFNKWEKEQPFRKADADSPAHDHAGLEAFGAQPATLGSPAEESGEATQFENSVDAADRPYRCDLCDKSYIHHRSLTNHKKTHQVGMFECTVCYKLFNNMSALYNHQRTHKAKGDGLAPGAHAATVTAPAERFSPQTQDVRVNFCHLCQVLFPTDAEFQEHIQMHNSSSSLSFGLQDGLSENRHLAYDSGGVASPEQPDFYASPINNVPSVSSVDSYTGFDLPDQPIRGSGGLFLDCPDSLPPPCNNTQGGPSIPDPGALGPAHAPHHQPHPHAAAADEDDERPFRCHICGKSYRHSGSLINHKRSHQVGIYQCSVCRKSYPHLAALKSHLRLHRAQPSSFSLATDGDWLSTEPQTLDSQQGGCSSRPGGMEAGSPRSAFGSEQENGSGYSNGTLYNEHYHHHSNLNQHVFSPDVTVDLPQNDAPMQRHMCADCGETFQDIAGIKSHSCPLLLLQHHDGFDGSVDFRGADPASDVDFCGMNGHNDQTYFQQSFHNGIDDDQLNGGPLLDDGGGGGGTEEEEEDEDGDLYQCSICGNSYTNMQALRSHLRGHTQSQGTPASSGPSSMSSHTDLRDDEFGEMIICSTCGESFSSRQDLVAHQLLHRQEQQQQQQQQEQEQQQQQQQQEQADDSASLGFNSSPMKSSPPGPGLQEEPHSIICGSCGIFCSSYHHLENHGCSGVVKDEEKLEGEANGAALQEEVSRVGETDSGEQRQFRCEQCGRSYRHAGSLLNHKKSHKTGVFKCLVCQKRFYNLLALKNHQRSHFDVKRHTCPECGKAFKIQKQLLSHLRRHKENQAKIQELNTQIQALMQMNSTRLEEEEPPSTPNASQDLKPSGRCTQRQQKQQQQQQQQQQQHRGLKVEETECEADQRPFSCDQCGRTYRHAGSLVNHRNSHKTGEYCCSVCSNTYSNQLAMKNHLRTHFANKKHSCPKCGKGFRGRKQLLAHNCAPHRKSRAANRRHLKSRAFRCRRCKQAFASADQLAAHVCGDPPPASSDGQEGPEEERPFKCNLCSRSYRHAGSLLNHKNTHKTGHFSCTFCSKPFTNPMALRNHTRIHTQQKKYVCLTCGKAFRLASILHNHQRVHSRPAAHLACPACGKSFQGRSGLKRHRCLRGRGSGRGGEQRGHRGEKCFTCDLCGRSYRHAGSLLNHKKSHSESLHQCTLCLQTFPDPVTLQMHSSMTRHCCPECGKTFCLVAHLQSHMDVHAKERSATAGGYQEAHGGAPDPYQHHPRGGDDAICWDSDMSLTAGVDDGHEPPPLSHLPDGFPDLQGGASEEKSHVCEHCGRTYRHAGSLLNHKYSHRTGSFSCGVCQKEFTNLMALRNHRRIHTEPKRYQCQDCGKAFRVSTQLICHRRIHTKEKPFGCPLCSKSFSSKSNLRHHQKMHAGGGGAVEAYDPAAFCADAADSFIDDLDMDAFL